MCSVVFVVCILMCITGKVGGGGGEMTLWCMLSLFRWRENVPNLVGLGMDAMSVTNFACACTLDCAEKNCLKNWGLISCLSAYVFGQLWGREKSSFFLFMLRSVNEIIPGSCVIECKIGATGASNVCLRLY